MEQIKIGKFIDERRKARNMTQSNLAEKLNITDRAVSKWENGKGMPDTSIMLELCEALEISVNELLTGEMINMENYNEKAEKNLLDMVNREQKANEKMMFYGYTVGGLSVASFLIIILLVAFVIENLYLQILLSTVAVIILMLDMLIGVKIESEAGYYECAKCHEKYVPKYVDAFFAMHIGTTRYLKCPHCQKYSWSKKVLTK